MAMSATLTVPGNIIAGNVATVTLAIANSGGSDVTVSSIQPVLFASGQVAPIQGVVAFGSGAFPIGRTKTVSAAGSLNVTLDMVFNVPQTPGLGPVSGGNSYLLDFVIQVSDGTVCSVTNPQWVSVSAGAPSPSQGYGQLRFDDGRNLINIAML